MKISKLITFLREKHNLTQQEFAQKVGLSLSTIQKYEYDNVQPKEKSILKIANSFGYTLESLKKEIENLPEKFNKTNSFFSMLDLISISNNENTVENIIKMKKILKIINRFEFDEEIYDIIEIKDKKTNEVFSFEIGFQGFSDIFSDLYEEIEKQIILFFQKEELKFLELEASIKKINPTEEKNNDNDIQE